MTTAENLQSLIDKKEELTKKYKKLPRKDSFSGWGLLSEIEEINKQIENLED